MQGMQDRHPGGTELLTAQQVQGMLGVDRSTVYRMAEDGRLPAVKVGRQWRFRPRSVDRILAIPADGTASGAAPLALVVTPVLTVAAELLGVMMLVTDMDGHPLSDVANPCPWFADRGSDPAVVATCVAEWRALADEPDLTPAFRTGLLGFECARAFMRTGSTLVGMVLAGGLAPEGQARPDLYQLDPEQRARVLAALPVVATALSTASTARSTS
jgi:excisionase family DNA binding protein